MCFGENMAWEGSRPAEYMHENRLLEKTTYDTCCGKVCSAATFLLWHGMQLAASSKKQGKSAQCGSNVRHRHTHIC